MLGALCFERAASSARIEIAPRIAPAQRVEEGPGSDFNLLGNGERVINFDAEIPDRAFHFRVAKQ
jgi:hypothetical protein